MSALDQFTHPMQAVLNESVQCAVDLINDLSRDLIDGEDDCWYTPQDIVSNAIDMLIQTLDPEENQLEITPLMKKAIKEIVREKVIFSLK
jgi:hypothetical protein